MTTATEVLGSEPTTKVVERLLGEGEHVVICLGSLTVHANGQPQFGCKVYGPFSSEDVTGAEREIRKLEGGATLIRPLVDLNDTYRRISAD